ncbi:hypothetical protein ACFL31_04315, partial [Candidatus Margulisiibacteriota bacterium]
INDSDSGDNIIIWGAGDYAKMMLKESSFFNKRNIKCFVDTNEQKHGKKFGEYDIKHPDAVLSDSSASIFIASTIYYREIYCQLLSMGVAKDRIIDCVVV